MAKLTSLEMAVARDAPATPISSRKMKMGSSTQLRTPPKPMPNMENRALPSARRHWFITKLQAMKGATSNT